MIRTGVTRLSQVGSALPCREWSCQGWRIGGHAPPALSCGSAHRAAAKVYWKAATGHLKVVASEPLRLPSFPAAGYVFKPTNTVTAELN